eukprot:TRINITY_DN6259_c0_g1_i1.p1 TRINITY_DN6259_c0_g1~~TRINITY_DN6259_c0_g1_i1.p1  ORF type:complete len:645 (-),score=195.86 TRINITY_DN6259_c0_g1_i1:89-2023(-)
MEELIVHVFRNNVITPSPIKIIQLSPSRNTFAVGRESSEIEIYDSKTLIKLFEIKGLKEEVGLTTICWTISEGKERLFSGMLNGFVCEWDFSTLASKFIEPSSSGAVWSIAANKTGTFLVAACHNQCVRIFDITDDHLYSSKALELEGRILAVEFISDDNFIAGTNTGLIFKFNAQTKQQLYRINLPSRLPTPVYVWCLKALRNKPIFVAGTSDGFTSLWDANNGTFLQSFRSHIAPVLCIAISDDENFIYSSGFDSTIAMIQATPNSSQTSGYGWIWNSKSRAQNHDIYGLIAINNLVIAGGISGLIFKHSIKSTKEKSFSISGSAINNLLLVPSKCSFSLSKKNILFCQHDRVISIFSTGFADRVGEENLKIKTYPKQLQSLKHTGRNLICHTSLTSEKSIACSDSKNTYIYCKDKFMRQLRIPELGPSNVLKFEPIKGYLILAKLDASILVFDIKSARIVKEFTDYTENISRIEEVALSNDGNSFSILNANGEIYMFSLNNFEEYSYLVSINNVLSISYNSNNTQLFIVTKNYYVYSYEMQTHKLNQIQFDFKFPTNSQLIGFNCCPSNPNLMLFYSLSFLALVSIDENYENGYVKSTNQYKMIQFASFLSNESDILVIEFNFVEHIQQLAPPLFRAKFST